MNDINNSIGNIEAQYPNIQDLKNVEKYGFLNNVRDYRKQFEICTIPILEKWNILESKLIDDDQILYKIEDLEGDIYNGKKPIFLNIYDLHSQEMKTCNPTLPEGWKILDVEFVDNKTVLYKFENRNSPVDYTGSMAIGIILYDIESNSFLDEGVSIPSSSLIKDIQIKNNEILLLLKNFRENEHNVYKYKEKGFEKTNDVIYNRVSGKILNTPKTTKKTEVISFQNIESAA